MHIVIAARSFKGQMLYLYQGKPFPLKVFDVGMNFGAFTLFASSLKCEVWGFEMQPHIFTLVDMSLRISGYRYEDTVDAFTFSLPTG